MDCAGGAEVLAAQEAGVEMEAQELVAEIAGDVDLDKGGWVLGSHA